MVLPDYAPPSESSTPGQVTDSFGNTVDITGDSDDYASLIRSNIQAASAAKAARGGADVNVYGEAGRGYLPPTTSSSDNDNDWGGSFTSAQDYTESRVADFASTGDWSRGFAMGGLIPQKKQMTGGLLSPRNKRYR